jgi:hypothetical protein
VDLKNQNEPVHTQKENMLTSQIDLSDRREIIIGIIDK